MPWLRENLPGLLVAERASVSPMERPQERNADAFRYVGRWLRGILLLGAFAGPVWAEQSVRPNILIVLADDQGYGDMSVHGNPVLRTPNLDRLHGESIRLTDFHVAPMCTPTRGQLMTGVDALRNGAMNVSSGRTLLRREF